MRNRLALLGLLLCGCASLSQAKGSVLHTPGTRELFWPHAKDEVQAWIARDGYSSRASATGSAGPWLPEALGTRLLQTQGSQPTQETRSHEAHWTRSLQTTGAVFPSNEPYVPCGVSGNYSVVGFQGALRAAQGAEGAQVTGTVTAYDDCYLAIQNLRVAGLPEGTAGLSVWAAAAGANAASDAAPVEPGARPLSPASLPLPLVVLYLEAGGLIWADVGAIYVCRVTAEGALVSVLAQVALPAGTSQLGFADSPRVALVRDSVMRAAAAQGLSMPPPPAQPPPPPPLQSGSSGPTSGLQNCIQAVPGALNIYWTVSGSVVEYGLEARVPDNSWIAFGFSNNQSGYQMLHSDVTVVGVPAPGQPAFALDYFITALEPCEAVAGGHVGVCPDALLSGNPGSNNVKLRAAAREGDVTVVRYRKAASTGDARYDVNLLSAGQGVGAPLWAVFAVGPLAPGSTSSSPRLLYHNEDQGFFKGGVSLTLQPGSPVFACPSPLWGTPAVSHPTLPPYVPPPPPGSSTPGPPRAPMAKIGGRSGCQATVGGEALVFPSCAALPGGFVLMWALTGLSLTALLSVQADTVGSTGYMAVGISPDGLFPGSSLLLARPQQVQATQMYAAGWQAAQVVPGGNLTVVATHVALDGASGRLQLLFTLLLLPTQTSACYVVWTRGSAVRGGLLSSDGIAGYSTSAISFKSGDTQAQPVAAPSGPQWAVHGALATVAWAVLVPLGVMAARYLRKLHPYWFLVHQTLQLSAFALGLVAFNLGWALPPSAHSARAHGALGVIIMLLSTLQVSAFLWRPDEDSKHRAWWRTFHAVEGAVLLVLAIAQVFVGLQISDASTALTIGFVIFLLLLLVCFLALELLYGNLSLALAKRLFPRLRSCCGLRPDSDEADAQSVDSLRPLRRPAQGTTRGHAPTALDGHQNSSSSSSTPAKGQGARQAREEGPRQSKGQEAGARHGPTDSRGPPSRIPLALEMGQTPRARGAEEGDPKAGTAGPCGTPSSKPGLGRSWSLALRTGDLRSFGETPGMSAGDAPVIRPDRFNVKATVVGRPAFGFPRTHGPGREEAHRRDTSDENADPEG